MKIWIVNLSIIIAVLYGISSGYRLGFIRKFLNIFSFFVIGFLAWWFANPISSKLSLYPKNQVAFGIEPIDNMVYSTFNRLTIFIVLFIIMMIALMLIKPFTKIIHSLPIISTLNRIMGAFFGCIQMLLILCVISVTLTLPLFHQQEVVENSLLRYGIAGISQALFFIDAPIKELSKIQSSLNNTQKLSKIEINNIYEWLLDLGVEKDAAWKWISMLEHE